MKTSGVFHISDHLQLTIKSLHVLFPSISLLKKHSTLKLQKQSVFILQYFRCLNTKKVKIKKSTNVKIPATIPCSIFERNLKRQTRAV